MRRASRVDANQSELVAIARQLGAHVLHLHQLGKDAPDLLIGFRRVNILIECKTKNGVLSPGQVEWHWMWPGQVAVARDADELIAIMEGV